MKKMIAVFALVFSLGALGENDTRSIVISGDTLSAVHGSLSALFQYKLTDYVALTVPGSFGTNWVATQSTKLISAIAGEEYTSSLLFGGAGLGARFFLNNKGIADGFFAEGRVLVSMSKYLMKKDTADLINSNRITLKPSLLLGYSWTWDSGFYLSTGIEVGVGYHMKNDITVDGDLEKRLADKYMLRNRLWADKGRWRFDYGYDVSLGFAF